MAGVGLGINHFVNIVTNKFTPNPYPVPVESLGLHRDSWVSVMYSISATLMSFSSHTSHMNVWSISIVSPFVTVLKAWMRSSNQGPLSLKTQFSPYRNSMSLKACLQVSIKSITIFLPLLHPLHQGQNSTGTQQGWKASWRVDFLLFSRLCWWVIREISSWGGPFWATCLNCWVIV